MSEAVPLDWHGLVGYAPPTVSKLDERDWYFAALVWCHRNSAGIEAARSAFTRHFGYPPKRWWDTPQEGDGFRVPSSIASALSELPAIMRPVVIGTKSASKR